MALVTSRGWAQTFLVIAAASLGMALQEGNGTLWADAIIYFSITTAAVLIAFGALASEPVRWPADRQLAWIAPVLAVVALCTFFGRILNTPPGMYVRANGNDYKSFMFAVGASAVVAGVGCTRASAFSRFQRVLLSLGLIGLFLFIGAWVLRYAPNPRIDVFLFQRDAATALLNGHSPYAMTFPDLYSPAESAHFYGPGLSVNGRLQFGYPYFPLSLLLVVPAQLWGQDVRFAGLTAMALAGLLLVLISPRERWGFVAAALLLFTPRSFFVLEESWTEPLLVALFALTVLVAVRAPRWVWLPLGLFVAAKQYGFLITPLALLLLPRPLRVRDVVWLAVRTAAVALVITLPFLIWSPEGFVRSVVTLQFHQPFREDSLSFMAWLWREHHTLLPGWLPFLAAGLVIAVGFWRLPRSPLGFAMGSALVFFAFFALNKQAFANYYYLVEGVLCAAIAAWDVTASRARTEKVLGSAET